MADSNMGPPEQWTADEVLEFIDQHLADIEEPFMGVRPVQYHFDMSHPTAVRYVRKLVDRGDLVSKQVGPAIVFARSVSVRSAGLTPSHIRFSQEQLSSSNCIV